MEHITRPRRTWAEAGLPLTRAIRNEPAPVVEDVRVKPERQRKPKRGINRNKHTGFYGVTVTPYGKYRMQFTRGLDVICGQVYDTPEAAAQAHDDYVLRHGIDRPLNFARVGNPTGEGA